MLDTWQATNSGTYVRGRRRTNLEGTETEQA